MEALKGKALTFAASKVSGPASLGCSKPRYEIRQAPPEGLFQAFSRPRLLPPSRLQAPRRRPVGWA